MIPAFTKEEKKGLATLEGKLSLIRDGVRGIAKEFHTGLVLHGEGGTSKSYTVLDELQKLKTKYVYHNTRLTARGLVDMLEKYKNDIHLIEDAETLLDDKKSFGVLRSALWSQCKQKPPIRDITWTAFKTTIRFQFTGGIIIISNVNLADSIPEIRAIKTRINVLGIDVSNDEIRALMKQICLDGYRYGDDYLTPDECWEVCVRIVERLAILQRALDLRLLMNGFRDFLQWRTDNSRNHWHNLLESRMQQKPVFKYKSRAEIKADEARIAADIYTRGLSTAKAVALWKEKTGLDQAAYYRALKRNK